MMPTSLRRSIVRGARALLVLLGASLVSAVPAQTSPAPVAAPVSPAASSSHAFADGVEAFDAGRHADAFRLWLPLAEEGRSQAQFNIAVMYEQGVGVAKSDVEAARWYLAAAEGGDTTAQAKVASLFTAGIGVAKDPDKAAYWSAQAAASSAHGPASAPSSREPLPGRSLIEPEDVTAFDGGRFVFFRAADGACVIALQGTVTRSANNKFDGVIDRAKAQHCAKPLTLLLESPGGLVDAGIELGRSVHLEDMNTVARYTCASSCSIIFLGGSERTIWGSRAAIGLHQPSVVRDGKKSCFTTNFDAPVVAMRRYVQFVVPESADRIMEVMIGTACESITWIKGQRAIDMGVATRIEAEHEDVFGPLSARLPKAASAPR